MSNPALALKEYITSNIGDTDGAWEYEHTPHIESVLKDLSKSHAEEFANKIWEWETYHLFHLANPILWIENENLEGIYLYVKIYSKLSDPEQLAYLTPYLSSYLSRHNIQRWETEILEGIINSLYLVINNVSKSKVDSYTVLIDKLNNELQKRTRI